MINNKTYAVHAKNLIRNFSLTHLIIKLVEFFKSLFRKKENVKAISVIEEKVKIKVRNPEPVVQPITSVRIEHRHVQEPQRRALGYIMTSNLVDHPEMIRLGFSRITGLPIYEFCGTDFKPVSSFLDSMYVTYS